LSSTEKDTETLKPDGVRPVLSTSTGEISPPAPLSASASALRALCAVGSGGDLPPRHRVVLWYSVMSVELDHPGVGGDKHAEERAKPSSLRDWMVNRVVEVDGVGVTDQELPAPEPDPQGDE
jgi:hypothetical protein